VSTDQLDNIKHGLTVRDPWSQAIVYGPKRIENRGKRPPEKILGERIAVQAGKGVDPLPGMLHKPPEMELKGWGGYETTEERHHPGHIIGTVRVVGYWVPSDNDCQVIASPESYWWDCINEEKGIIRTDLVESNPWWQGPVGWLLADPQPLDEPIPARGMPGVWNVDKQVKEAQS